MQSQRQIVNLIGAALDGLNLTSAYSIWPAVETEFGLHQIGSGGYGAVFRHPTNYDLVIKVGYDKSDGWLDYAAFCMANRPGNPELLEVHDVRVFKQCFVAVMERLDPVGSYDDAHPMHQQRLAWREGYDLTPALRKLYHEIDSFNDLHAGNIMRRKDQIVITDPFARGNCSYKSYLTANGRIDVSVKLAPEPVIEPVGLTKGVMDVVARGFAKLEPGRWRIPQRWQEADFRASELRALQHMQQIPKRRDQIGRMEWLSFVGLTKVDYKVFVQLKKRAEVHDAVHYEPLPRERALVVKDGSPAAIRAEKEDRMLRVRSKHDNTAYTQGIQRALLPECRSRRVQAARIAIVERATGPAAGYNRNAGWGVKPAVRFYPKHPPEQDALAA